VTNTPISSGWRTRLVAKLRGWSIDEQLLEGRPPDGNPVISARLRRLLDRRYRAAVAGSLRKMLESARQRRAGRWVPQVPVRVNQVLELEPLILTLADEVEAEERVSPRGVILADRLIRDGTSPVYWRGDMSISAESARRSVELAVRHARSALLLG
jgi:hypothetical protein